MHQAEVVHTAIKWDLLRADMQAIKARRRLTFDDIGKQCKCHGQSVYKFFAGEYARVGARLFRSFAEFVVQHSDGYANVDHIIEERYLIRTYQYRLPLE